MKILVLFSKQWKCSIWISLFRGSMIFVQLLYYIRRGSKNSARLLSCYSFQAWPIGRGIYFRDRKKLNTWKQHHIAAYKLFYLNLSTLQENHTLEWPYEIIHCNRRPLRAHLRVIRVDACVCVNELPDSLRKIWINSAEISYLHDFQKYFIQIVRIRII